MIEKIISVNNVGRFANCAAAGDVTFRQYTLVFAENGRGKTTLCATLRSLSTGNPAFILGRKTLGSMQAPEVQILTSNGVATFRNGAWSTTYPDIVVFDGTYVSENVFAGEVVDTEHRRNLYRVFIGAVGVALARRLNDLDERVRAKSTEIRDERTRLQHRAPVGMTIEAFIALPEDPAIDAKVAAKQQELQAAQRAAELQQRAGLTAAAPPSFPTAFAAVLAKTLANVSADAERRVREHIAAHQMQARGETWLAEGLRFDTAVSCPFCGQALAGADLLRAYRDFFSREYHALRDEVRDLIGQVEAAFGDRLAAGIERTVVQNGAAADFWREYCALTPPVLPEAGRAGETIVALRNAALDLLRRKAATPLEAVAPGGDFTEALAEFEALRTSIAAYNNGVAAANVVIEARKRETQTANVRDIEGALALLNAHRVRHTDEVRALCTADERLQGEKNALEGEKATAREQLDAHTQQVIAHYGNSINRYLERINAGFRITAPTHSYRGGVPSTSYQILINQCPVDLGDATTPIDRPSFKNTLSTGDRNTLALAFFLAQLEQDPDRARKVVVFDDPFSSLDSFRRNHTIHQIYKCGETCTQVVLLSHEPMFLKLLWDRVQPAGRKTIQLGRIGEENTTIVEWDIEKAVQARYKADIETLHRFFADGEGERREVIQKLRPVLEGYCSNLYPTHFAEADTLGVMVGKIQAMGTAHPLSSIVDDLNEVNVYCRRYHHQENPGGAATEPIDDAELKGYVRRALALVGCLL